MSKTPDTPAQPNSPKPWEHAKSAGSASDPLAVRFVESLSYDRRLYTHDITGSIAHARMLAHVNLITADELTQIETGLRSIEQEITDTGDAWPGWNMELEDVHMCIEAALIEKIGDAGRKLHTARSRNDQVALDLKLWVEDAANELRELFDGLFRALVDLSQKQGMIVMPSYTHLQRAQPIVLGGELMAWLSAFDRCQRRVTALRTVNKRNPIGSGAIAGSGLPIDRDHTVAELSKLGYDVGSPTPNSIDATASRDAALDFAYALSMTAMNMSRLAEQWILYASTEFNFVTIDDKYTTGSSMMPQKQNPDMLELIRGRCGNVYGALVALLTMCKGITVGYNRDLQEDKRHLFFAFDTVRDSLLMTTRIVSTVTFNEQAIGERLQRGFLDATALADYLVMQNVPFRTAHQIVGKLVHTCQQRNLTQLSDLSVDEMNTLADHSNCFTDEVYQWLGPANVVKRYQSQGNAGVSGFEQQLDAWVKRLG